MPEFDATVTYRPTPSLPAESYRVGSDGTVWSCHKKGWGAKGGAWRPLKPLPTGRGYRAVRQFVRRGVANKTHYIHRLVLEAFVGPCPPGLECCHDDGDPANNRLENLRWDTSLANKADMRRHGKQPMGERHYKAKLREQDIPAIRWRAAMGEPLVDIAKDYGMTDATIGPVVNRKTWKHV